MRIDEMTAAEFDKLVYPFLDDETKAQVDALDPGDRAYFWAYVKETLPMEWEREYLNEMEQKIIRALKKLPPKGLDEAVAMPFAHAESQLKPGSWFTRSCIQ